MADGPGYSNSVRAGAFLVTGVVLALVVVFILNKSNPFASKNRYSIRFDMAEGVAGLEVGSEVRVSGLKVGRVESIEQKFDVSQGEEPFTVVRISVHSDIKVRKATGKDKGDSAKVMRAQTLLGNYSWLNFTSLGSGEEYGPEEAIDARSSGGMLGTIVGPENAERADKMFTSLVTFTDVLDDFASDTYRNDVKPMLRSANATMTSVEREWGAWKGKIGETLASAASGSRKFDETMDDAKAASASLRATMDDVRGKYLKQIDGLLQRAQDGTDSFAKAMERVDSELVQRIPELRAMMADLREGAAQAKLATMEVRRSPWKLFYTPTGDELARENLYEAARAFALASSDMRVAGETLESALREPERVSADPALRDELRNRVLKSLERYETAQRQLFDVLKADLGDVKPPEAKSN